MMRDIVLFILICVTVITIVLVLSGCTVVQEKADRYEEAAREIVNAPNVKLCYQRTNDNLQYIMEYRCSGQSCQLPECPK